MLNPMLAGMLDDKKGFCKGSKETLLVDVDFILIQTAYRKHQHRCIATVISYLCWESELAAALRSPVDYMSLSLSLPPSLSTERDKSDSAS